MDTFAAFLKALKAGELEPFIKSEPVPETQGKLLLVPTCVVILHWVSMYPPIYIFLKYETFFF